jgi:hypothetical protein
MNRSDRTIRVRETPRVPLDGLLLGWGAMVPFPLLAAVCWWGGAWAGTAAVAAQLWGGALLLFFAGVRRGLSFRTEGGPRLRQLIVFALLFCTGLFVLILPVATALVVVAGALAALALEDVGAATRGEAPLYFRRLRPAQMTFAVASVLLCWWAV